MIKTKNTNEKTQVVTVKIVDSIMGSGKTEAAITYMNSAFLNKKFIYITPYLDEVQRIKDRCPERCFVEPLTTGRTKSQNIKDLILDNRNIATTHALFQLFDNETVELIQQRNYTLILDEVINVIENYHIMPQDLKNLINTYVTVDAEGYIHWREDQKDYVGEKFQKEKQLCETQSLKLFGDNLLMWMLPVTRFTAFKEIIILTYLFDGQIQKYYYDLHNIQYKYLYVTHNKYGYIFTEKKPEKQNILKYSELITIIEDDKLNKIGDYEYSLSKTWYQKNTQTYAAILKENLYNLFRNRKIKYNEKKDCMEKTKVADTLWTTFKDYKKHLKGKGYTDGFISLNTRATNEYQDRAAVAYLVNRYCNPLIKRFFNSYGVEIDEDMYALSEMLQFIWRSRIRQGRPITVYIPSLRMRELLKEWIREQDGEQMQRARSMKKR